MNCHGGGRGGWQKCYVTLGLELLLIGIVLGHPLSIDGVIPQKLNKSDVDN